MRRPHIYERSVPRARRDVEQESGVDYVPAAHAVLAAVPDLLRQAEACGAVALARHLGQALSEAEGIVRRGGASGKGHQEQAADHHRASKDAPQPRRMLLKPD